MSRLNSLLLSTFALFSISMSAYANPPACPFVPEGSLTKALNGLKVRECANALLNLAPELRSSWFPAGKDGPLILNLNRDVFPLNKIRIHDHSVGKEKEALGANRYYAIDGSGTFSLIEIPNVPYTGSPLLINWNYEGVQYSCSLDDAQRLNHCQNISRPANATAKNVAEYRDFYLDQTLLPIKTDQDQNAAAELGDLAQLISGYGDVIINHTQRESMASHQWTDPPIEKFKAAFDLPSCHAIPQIVRVEAEFDKLISTGKAAFDEAKKNNFPAPTAFEIPLDFRHRNH